MSLIEMYKSLGEGDEWEYRECDEHVDTVAPGYNEYKFEWKPYTLGEEIHSDWHYRKIEKWYVCMNGFGALSLQEKVNPKSKFLFKGTKAQCEKYIEDNKNCWLNTSAEEFAKLNHTLYFARMDGTAPDDEDKLRQVYKDVAIEVSKKILEEVGEEAEVVLCRKSTNDKVGTCKLKYIISNLGVEV